ncbi:hypothetical protein L3Q82_006870 [Xyrichtys novacula]|uniref:Uncharacterized protein n=1 Tax=Xyrichtys novacula TaxID=13765 RepID=A0AAV1GAG5_XYRNO|nr:hypothetical protein L3Q82_006870 [Xyrichtys novacula]
MSFSSLAVCLGLSLGQSIPAYILVKRMASWSKAREFCQKHYIDLAVVNKEEQYFTLLDLTASVKDSFWLGLQQQNTSVSWMWVDGEELTYDHWYKRYPKGHCAILEAMLEGDKTLLGRYCDEMHMFICQGPVSPQSVKVDSVSSDGVALSWEVSAFMQMTPHSYNVTIYGSTRETLIYHYAHGSTSMSINITNLTSDTEFLIEVSASVVRPDGDAGRDVTLQSPPTALEVKTVDSFRQPRGITLMLKLLKLVSLGPPLFVLYHILKKSDTEESDHDLSTDLEHAALETRVELVPERIRGVGHGSEIIGGKEVKRHSLPFMALLMNRGPDCGGILISPKWVLTAAHCGEIKEVILGVHAINETEKNARQVLKVKRFPHPCYDADEHVNDLMLLKLKKAAKKTKTVQWLDLGNTIKDPAAGTICKVAGWGRTNNIGKMSNVLMAVNVTVIDRYKCNSQGYYNLTPIITRGMVCAGSDGQNSADTCQGDSGGPLLCNGQLVGVTSFGKKCGLIKKPGVYAFLSEKQLDWIKKTMKKSDI